MFNDRLPSQLSRLLLAIALAGCAPAAATGTPVSAPTPALSTPTSAPIPTRSASPTPAPTEPSPTEPPTAEPTQAATSTAQPELIPGTFVEMVYHTGLGQVVLVNGGPESGKPANDPVELWGWDGAVWSLLSADEDGPRWRNGTSVAYDAARGQLVLFGGSQGRRNMRDMWLWDGAEWTQVRGDLPPYAGNTGIAYDVGRERVVLFGGSDVQFNLLAETWEWDGEVWTLVNTEGPAPRFPAAMTYDAGRGEVLMYGGHSPAVNGDFQNWGDTWGWDGTTWHAYTAPESPPGIRVLSRAEYDGNRNVVLLFGGVPDDDRAGPLGDLWAWDGAAWTLLDVPVPSPRELHAMAYDAGREVMVLFGGFEAPPYLGTPPLRDTWEWDGMGWRCVSGCGE